MKKLFKGILASVLAVSALAGCSNSTETPGKEAAGGPTQEQYAQALLGNQAERWELIKGQAKGTEKITFYGPIDAILPEAKNMNRFESTYAEGYAHYGYGVPYKSGPAALMYDKRYVKNPPQSFEELEKWIQENPGKFAYSAKGGSGEAFVLSAIYWLTGGEMQYTEQYREELIKNWESVWEWLNKIEPNIVYGSDNNDVLDKFSRGEVTMAAVWEDEALRWVNSGTLPKEVGFYMPKPGYIAKSGGFLSIPSNSPNKAAALLWINYLLQKDVVDQFVENEAARIARKDSKMPEKYQSFLIPDEQLKELGKGFPVPEYKNKAKDLFLEKVAAQ